MYKEVTDYLSQKNIAYKTSGDKTEAIINCLFCEDTKYHLYINNTEGCFLCHKCGARGSWKNLVENLGDTSSPQLESNPSSKIEYTAQLETSTFDPQLAKGYHENLPDRIKEYLKSEVRGLADETIEKYQLGWDGKSITIPIYDTNNNLINIRYRRDPEKSDGPKIWGEKGGKVSLFNIQELARANEQNDSYVLIVEGEFDAMVATQFGFPAISGTGGASTFKKEWLKDFEEIETVYVCYDSDKAGQDGAKRVAALFEGKARIVELPTDSEGKIDVTDYFGRLKHTVQDFQELLDKSKAVEVIKKDFELSESRLQHTLHPALDYYDNELYLALSLPVKIGSSETVKSVVISSSKQKGLLEKNIVTIGDKKLVTRKITGVPKDQVRWQVEDVQSFLSSATPISVALPFIEIRQVLLKFVDFRKEIDADILALWIIGTYCFPIFDAISYLYFVGVKRSGKTKTLLLIEKLAFNAILSSNISPAVLFRLVEAKRCTLALDEGEQLADKVKKEELRELLNSGYKRGAPAYRVKKGAKGGFEIEAFEIYGPKAIANISGLDNVLEDRAITITMMRTDNPAKGNLAVTEGAENWSYLRSLLYSFALTYAKDMADIYSFNPEVNALLNRQNELWRPLLSIAKVIDTGFAGLFNRMRDEAIRRSEESAGADLEDFDSAVLLALRELADSEGETTVTNKEIRDKACEFLEEDQQKYFTSRGIGATLKRFGVQGKKIQGYWRYTVSREALNDLLTRYGLQVDDE